MSVEEGYRGYDPAPEGSFNLTNFLPQGPVAAAFLKDDEHLFRAIMGPWGSGKTNTAFMDMFGWAVKAPACDPDAHGVVYRRFSALVVRDTYRNLNTTLKTWHGWVPATKGKFTGGQGDRPGRHELEWDLLDGTVLHLVVEFRAIGDQKVEDALLGAEFNWVFLNELTTLPIDVVTYCQGRVGRYPHPKLLGEDKPRMDARPRRVIADLNAPDVDTPVYLYFEEQCPPTAKLYRQPGGRDPAAENIFNLPKGYYSDLIAANAARKWFIRRFVDNEYGYSRDGIPVFEEEYSDIDHVADFNCDPSFGIYLGFDGGMGIHPAASMFQWLPSGHIRKVAELAPGRCLTGRFCEMLTVWLKAHAQGANVLGAWVDPAAFRGQNSSDGATREDMEYSFITQVSRVIGRPLMPAPTNEIADRLGAISLPLSHRIGARPMLQYASKHCPLTRRAMNSAYRYKVDNSGSLTMDVTPEKNDASHIIDADQYGLLGMIGVDTIRNGRLPAARPRETSGARREGRTNDGARFAKTDFDPHASW